MLFHLADPARAAAEAARVLRPGGRAGIITWAWERQPRASTVWDQVLAEAGVPPAPLRRVDSGLDQPGAVDALLRSVGLRPERIWHDRLHHEWDRSSFWELASGSGSNRIRLSQLGSAARAGVLARLTSTLSQLGPGDFVWEGEVICAVATKHSFGTDHPGKEPLPGARPIWNSLMAASWQPQEHVADHSFSAASSARPLQRAGHPIRRVRAHYLRLDLSLSVMSVRLRDLLPSRRVGLA